MTIQEIINAIAVLEKVCVLDGKWMNIESEDAAKGAAKKIKELIKLL